MLQLYLQLIYKFSVFLHFYICSCKIFSAYLLSCVWTVVGKCGQRVCWVDNRQHKTALKISSFDCDDNRPVCTVSANWTACISCRSYRWPGNALPLQHGAGRRVINELATVRWFAAATCAHSHSDAHKTSQRQHLARADVRKPWQCTIRGPDCDALSTAPWVSIWYSLDRACLHCTDAGRLAEVVNC